MDLDEGKIHLTHTKGKQDRSVPIAPETVGVLRRLLPQTLKQGGPFIGMGHNINRAWKRIRDKAGVHDATIHDLRRTFVTRALRSGADVDVVRRMVGHASLDTTMTYYAWANDGDLRKAGKKMSQAAAG